MLQNGRGGDSSLTPTKKRGGGETVFAMLKGEGHKQFLGSFDVGRLLKFSHADGGRGGGCGTTRFHPFKGEAWKMLPRLERGRVAKSWHSQFSHFVAPHPPCNQ